MRMSEAKAFLPSRPEKKGIVVKKGIVTEALPARNYRVLMEDKTKILAYISGRMSQNFIRVFPGDTVRVELSEHDLTKGRIVYRY